MFKEVVPVALAVLLLASPVAAAQPMSSPVKPLGTGNEAGDVLHRSAVMVKEPRPGSHTRDKTGDVPRRFAVMAKEPRPGSHTRDKAVDLPQLGLRRMALAKWGTLAGSLGAGTLGFVRNQQADARYAELEELCMVDRDACRDRLPDGAYADPALEEAYQEVVRLDRGARGFMLAGQIGLAASVVLFIVDLRDNDTPPNIPFQPKTGFRITPQRDGGVGLGWKIRM